MPIISLGALRDSLFVCYPHSMWMIATLLFSLQYVVYGVYTHHRGVHLRQFLLALGIAETCLPLEISLSSRGELPDASPSAVHTPALYQSFRLKQCFEGRLARGACLPRLYIAISSICQRLFPSSQHCRGFKGVGRRRSCRSLCCFDSDYCRDVGTMLAVV